MSTRDEERPSQRNGRLQAFGNELRPFFARPCIWEGVVAEGAVTLLSAPEKVGKTRRRKGVRLDFLDRGPHLR
jgi:hypothetical protein